MIRLPASFDYVSPGFLKTFNLQFPGKFTFFAKSGAVDNQVTYPALTRKKINHKIPSDIAGNLGAMPKWEFLLIEGERNSYEGEDTFNGTTAARCELALKKKHSLYTNNLLRTLQRSRHAGVSRS